MQDAAGSGRAATARAALVVPWARPLAIFGLVVMPVGMAGLVWAGRQIAGPAAWERIGWLDGAVGLAVFFVAVIAVGGLVGGVCLRDWWWPPMLPCSDDAAFPAVPRTEVEDCPPIVSRRALRLAIRSDGDRRLSAAPAGAAIAEDGLARDRAVFSLAVGDGWLSWRDDAGQVARLALADAVAVQVLPLPVLLHGHHADESATSQTWQVAVLRRDGRRMVLVHSADPRGLARLVEALATALGLAVLHHAHAADWQEATRRAEARGRVHAIER